MFTELRPDGFSTKLRIGSPRFDVRDTNGACQLCEAPPAVYTTRLPPEHEIGSWRGCHATNKERCLRPSDPTIAAPNTAMARPTQQSTSPASNMLPAPDAGQGRQALRRGPQNATRDDADVESCVTAAEWMRSSGSPDGHATFGVNPLDLNLLARGRHREPLMFRRRHLIPVATRSRSNVGA